MLSYLRDHAKSWFIKVLLGFICVVFVFFFGGSQFGSDPNNTIAQVNGELLNQVDFIQQVQAQERQYRAIAPDGINPQMLSFLNRMVIERFVTQTLLIQYAHRIGLQVGDDELRQHIQRQYPVFQQEGQFNPEAYHAILKANRIDPARLEDQERKNLLAQKVRDLIENSLQVSRIEVEDAYRFREDKRTFSFVKLTPLNMYPAFGVPSDQDIQKRLEADRQRIEALYTMYQDPYFKAPAGEEPAYKPLATVERDLAAFLVQVDKIQQAFVSYPRLSSAFRRSQLRLEDTEPASRNQLFIKGLSLNEEDTHGLFQLGKKNEVLGDALFKSDGVYLVAVKEVNPPKVSVPADDFKELEEELLSAKRQQFFQAWLEKLRQHAEIKVYNDRISS